MMGERINTLERKSEKIRKCRKKSKAIKTDVSPTRLNFELMKMKRKRLIMSPQMKKKSWRTVTRGYGRKMPVIRKPHLP